MHAVQDFSFRFASSWKLLISLGLLAISIPPIYKWIGRAKRDYRLVAKFPFPPQSFDGKLIFGERRLLSS